jgi:hypothetical protein
VARRIERDAVSILEARILFSIYPAAIFIKASSFETMDVEAGESPASSLDTRPPSIPKTVDHVGGMASRFVFVSDSGC